MQRDVRCKPPEGRFRAVDADVRLSRSACAPLGLREVQSIGHDKKGREPSGVTMGLWDLVGCVAAALVLAAFCMRDMVPLRIAALCSNVAFIAYGLALGLAPVWLLHALLLPMNGYRLLGEVRARRVPVSQRIQRADEHIAVDEKAGVADIRLSAALCGRSSARRRSSRLMARAASRRRRECRKPDRPRPAGA